MMKSGNHNNSLLWKYASLATQLFILLGLSVYGGIKLDKLLAFTQPILVWILPLVIIIALIMKVIKDTATPK